MIRRIGNIYIYIEYAAITIPKHALAVIVSELFDPLRPLFNRFFEAILILSKPLADLVANVVVDTHSPIPKVVQPHSSNSANTRSVVGLELGAVARILHGCGNTVWIVGKHSKIVLAIIGSNSIDVVDDLTLGKLGITISMEIAAHRKAITTVLLPVVAEVDIALGDRRMCQWERRLRE